MENKKLNTNYLKTLTVLYVEDEEETRKQISQFLTRFVGRLVTTVNGTEGLEAFITDAPDIVITDIHMPEMDGLAMAREIRKISAKVPIVALTAFEEATYMMSAIEISMTKYIIKPVSSNLLLDSLIDCASRLREELQAVRLLTVQRG